MRLIDADFVISMLTIDSLAVQDQKYLKAINRAMEIVKSAPRFGKWIKPDERLPEDFQRVVFVTKTEDILLGVFYDDTKEFWDKMAYSIDEVEYWVAIPELPEE